MVPALYDRLNGIHDIGNDKISKGERWSMTGSEREALIAQYAAGYDTILESLAGITGDEWEAREAPGEWSPRQVIHHLADSEMTSAIRVRRLIVEDNPVIVGYDQDQYADCLFYDRPVEASLAAFKAARDSTVPILRRLDEAQWQRAGTHTESGHYSVEGWLQIYADHADIHADQILRARATVND
jgi:DinB superfamily